METLEMIDYDDRSDVAYVKAPGAQIVRSSPIEGDGYVILNFDAGGNVVGLQLIGTRDLSQGIWREFFRTGEIPPSIFDAVDAWLGRRGRPDAFTSAPAY